MTDEELTEFERNLDLSAWHDDYSDAPAAARAALLRAVPELLAEVKRLRAERSENASLLATMQGWLAGWFPTRPGVTDEAMARNKAIMADFVRAFRVDHERLTGKKSAP